MLFRSEEILVAALPLYAKFHSYGEYVFDWAWADAYRRNGIEYYPKLLSAIPFTPVSGPRLMATDDATRAALIAALHSLQQASGLSSTHILYPPESEARQLEAAGFMLRKGVQFHWQNQGYDNFEQFLATLEQKKRKNIRAERRKVAEAGISIDAVLQREADEVGGEGSNQTDLIILTHDCVEARMNEAMAKMQALSSVMAPIIRIRKEALA